MINCLHCKQPNPSTLNTLEWEGFTIKTLRCNRCGKTWKDFGGDTVLAANKEPPKILEKHDDISDNSS
jgi:transposase-like protein